MPNEFAQVLKAANTEEVTVPPYTEIRFRVRMVSTAMLAEVGSAMTLALGAPAPAGGQRVPDAGDLRRTLKMTDAVVAAGVVAINFGKGWREVGEELRLVTDPTERNPDEGRFLPTEDFPPGLAAGLMGMIFAIGTDQEGAAKRIATFLGQPTTP